MSNAILVNNTTSEKLTETILNGIKKELHELKKSYQPKEPEEWLTRKSTAHLLKISLVTIHEWVNKGVLKPYKIANRTYFNRREIEQLLFNSNK